MMILSASVATGTQRLGRTRGSGARPRRLVFIVDKMRSASKQAVFRVQFAPNARFRQHARVRLVLQRHHGLIAPAESRHLQESIWNLGQSDDRSIARSE